MKQLDATQASQPFPSTVNPDWQLRNRCLKYSCFLGVILWSTAQFVQAETGAEHSLTDTAYHGDLQACGPLEALNAAGKTALMVAAKQGQLPVVQQLLEAGARVNTQNAEGWTALMSAARNGYLSVVE